MPEIKLENISKSYNLNDKVLDDISVTIHDGEFFVLIGPSGSGKSTLLRLISGLDNSYSGILRIDGNNVNKVFPKDRNLTMVFQNYALYPNMTVKDNIIFGLNSKKISKQEQIDRLQSAVELVGLEDYLNRKPGELSGGQRQRVALARSICSKAPIFLMDEPLSNLDAKLRSQMRTEIKSIQRRLGLTMIYVTHDQLEAMTMGDRIMILDGGKISQIGTPIELYNYPKNIFTASFIGIPQMNILDGEIDDGKIIIENEIIIDDFDSSQQRDLDFSGSFKVGIRPEKINIKKGETESVSGELKILNVELLGNETQIVLDNKGKQLLIKCPGQVNLTIGEKLPIRLSYKDLYLFDNASGKTVKYPDSSSFNGEEDWEYK